MVLMMEGAEEETVMVDDVMNLEVVVMMKIMVVVRTVI